MLRIWFEVTGIRISTHDFEAGAARFSPKNVLKYIRVTTVLFSRIMSWDNQVKLHNKFLFTLLSLNLKFYV